MSAGIDYGMGTSNINHDTGIRYGVIAQNSVVQAWCDSAEPDYGEPTCPKCGNMVREHTVEEDQWFPRYREYGCHDYDCETCEHTLDSSDCFGDEPIDWHYDSEGYKLTTCLDTNVFVLESPYYTLAPFCSPCVPGAGDLDNAREDGVETYCLGHDWFEEGKAPYPVYSVATRELVSP